MDAGPGPGEELEGEGRGWRYLDGSIVNTQLRVPLPFLQHPSPALLTPPSLRAQDGVGNLTTSPFPSGVQCLQVGPDITPCL